jgi:hypothetical protein
MNAVPPKLARAGSGPRLAAILLAAFAAGGATLVFFFDPTTHHFYPVCQFHRLTGLNCPGCGMTRALYALLHGEVMTALRDNALLVAAIPVLLVRGLWFALKKPEERAAAMFLPVRWVGPLVIVTLLFTVLRNLPAFAFLSPQ